MGRFVLLAFAVILVGCSNSAPVPVTAPAVFVTPTLPASDPDVSATVEAAVEATRAADRMLRTASGAIPGSTVPTETPVPMTLLIPTPEPFVVAPGQIEGVVDKLYDCIQEDEAFRNAVLSVYRADLAGSGVSKGGVEFFEDEIFGKRENFLDLVLFEAREDPDYAVLLASMHGMMDGFCDEGTADSFGTSEPLVVSSADVEASLGRLYDCMQENRVLKSIYLSQSRASLVDAGFSQALVDTFEEVFMEDRENFIEFVGTAIEQIPGNSASLAPLNKLVDALCGGDLSGTVHDLGMSDSDARDLVGDLFDCVIQKQSVRESFLSEFSEFSGTDYEEIVDLLFSDRKSFIDFFLAGMRQDPDVAVQLAELDELLRDGCQ